MTRKRVRNSHGKRANSVRAIEGLLHFVCCFSYYWYNVCGVKSNANIKSRKKVKILFFRIRANEAAKGGGMGPAFHQLCQRYSGTLTPTAPTAIWQLENLTYRVQ